MTNKPEKIDTDEIRALRERWRKKADSDPEDVLFLCFRDIDALLAEVERLEKQLAEANTKIETLCKQVAAAHDFVATLRTEARNATLEQAAERVGMWRRHIRERFPKEYMTVRPCLEAIAAELCGMKEKP